MPPSTTIPRFLLPQGGAIWRTRIPQPYTASLFIRNASKGSKKGSKPLVLEKPTKFNPPSHGARRRTEAPRYPGPQLSAEEKAKQDTKKYPNMMPPEGSFMHWFLHNRAIHMWITMVRYNPLSKMQTWTNSSYRARYSAWLLSYSLQTSRKVHRSPICYLPGGSSSHTPLLQQESSSR